MTFRAWRCKSVWRAEWCHCTEIISGVSAPHPLFKHGMFQIYTDDLFYSSSELNNLRVCSVYCPWRSVSRPLHEDKLLWFDVRNLPSCVWTRIHKVVVSSHRFLSERSAGLELHRNRDFFEVFQTLQPHIKDNDVPFAPLFLSGCWCGLHVGPWWTHLGGPKLSFFFSFFLDDFKVGTIFQSEQQLLSVLKCMKWKMYWVHQTDQTDLDPPEIGDLLWTILLSKN